MKKYVRVLINICFFGSIVCISLIIATLSLTKKINNDAIQYDKGITASVVKQQVPILSFSTGIVKKMHVRIGQKVKKNDLLLELENPLLEGKIQALQSHKDNLSAQTEADVAKEEMKTFEIYSPINGVVTDMYVSVGAPVQSLTKLLNLYSDDNIELLANLSDSEYQAIQQLPEIKAYSKRLNQEFIIQPDILQPNETVNQLDKKQIGLFFSFKDKEGAQSLLENEDVSLQLQQTNTHIEKPIDYIVNFWNRVFGKKK